MAREEIQSEVTGTVWKIETKVGDAIAEGDTLMILESMKMEIPVISTEAGKLVEILVKEEEPVAEGQAVAVIELA
jgi:acetyl-CoA carboxylase biotin carboxyl carrier protein